MISNKVYLNLYFCIFIFVILYSNYKIFAISSQINLNKGNSILDTYENKPIDNYESNQHFQRVITHKANIKPTGLVHRAINQG
jgi:hypothetical protein